MAKRGRVRVSGTYIEYEVRRSKRRKKTIQLTVEGGVARVAAPSVVPLSELREFVRQRARWILDRLSRAAERGSRCALSMVRSCHTWAAASAWWSGERTWTYRRSASTICVCLSRRRAPCLWTGAVRWSSPRSQPGTAARAEEHVRASVERWRSKFGVSVMPPVLIGAQRSFWGSCSPDGTLRFSWRTMMLGARTDRLHRGPRAGPPGCHEPLEGFLGGGVQGDAGRAATPSSAEGGRAGYPAMTGSRNG